MKHEPVARSQLAGNLPSELGTISHLVHCDLSHNALDGTHFADALDGLSRLSTLRLAHNKLPPRALPPLIKSLSALSLRRLELYANPLASDETYPDALLRVQPKIVQVPTTTSDPPCGLFAPSPAARPTVPGCPCVTRPHPPRFCSWCRAARGRWWI